MIEVIDNEFYSIYYYITQLDTISIYGIYFILVDIFYKKFKFEFNSGFTLFFLEEFFEYYKDKFSVKEFNHLINDFLEEKYKNIKHIFNYRVPIKDEELFFKQPELILIYYSLLNDEFNFIEEWKKHFDIEILNVLATWFGLSII